MATVTGQKVKSWLKYRSPFTSQDEFLRAAFNRSRAWAHGQRIFVRDWTEEEIETVATNLKEKQFGQAVVDSFLSIFGRSNEALGDIPEKYLIILEKKDFQIKEKAEKIEEYQAVIFDQTKRIDQLLRIIERMSGGDFEGALMKDIQTAIQEGEEGSGKGKP